MNNALPPYPPAPADYDPPPAMHAIAAAAVDIAALPADPAEPAVGFDVLAAHFGIELWPLPEFSHDQFLRDHDHEAWLQEWARLERVLRVVDLDQPWVVREDSRVDPRESGARHYADCGLCDHRTEALRKRPRDANRDGAEHARRFHAWSPPVTRFARTSDGRFVRTP